MLVNSIQLLLNVTEEHVCVFQPHLIGHPHQTTLLQGHHHHQHHRHHIQHPREKQGAMLENRALNIVGNTNALNTDALNINEPKRGVNILQRSVGDDDKLFSSRCFMFSSRFNATPTPFIFTRTSLSFTTL